MTDKIRDLAICAKVQRDAEESGDSIFCSGCDGMHEPNEPAVVFELPNLGFSATRAAEIRIEKIRVSEQLS